MTLLIAGLALLFSVAALVIVLLDRKPPSDTPVEGIDGLDATLGCDLPTAPLPQPRPGAIYTGSHRRKGPSRWMAYLGRPHRGRPHTTVRRLP